MHSLLIRRTVTVLHVSINQADFEERGQQVS
jgi:hypothetical protein